MEPENSNANTTSGPLRARDVMTAKVITVGPNEPARAVARLLLDNGISAAPVIDAEGTPIGMVSEGDLVGRDEIDRLSRHDWWLAVMLPERNRSTTNSAPASTRPIARRAMSCRRRW